MNSQEILGADPYPDRIWIQCEYFSTFLSLRDRALALNTNRKS